MTDSENRKKILELLAEKKISVDDAYRLLNTIDAVEKGQESTSKMETAAKAKPKYLRVTILPDPECENSEKVDRVNVRVPMSLIRAGIKFSALIPPEARDKVNGALKGERAGLRRAQLETRRPRGAYRGSGRPAGGHSEQQGGKGEGFRRIGGQISPGMKTRRGLVLKPPS